MPNTYRSVSPTRMLDPKPNSPFTPHPLQFISPQRANSPVKPKTPMMSSLPSTTDGPPKPQRMFMTPLSDRTSIDDENEMTPSKTWKTEKTFVIGESKKACSPICAFTSSKSTTSNTATNDELECTEEYERHDTASRRSILEKRNIFEGTSASSPSKDSPDPAMLPLSQRKALFEKNRSVPKPIARFGESVTPAMLSKAKKLKTY